MTPHEFDNCRDRFDTAASALGWRRHVYLQEHERDDCRPWEIAGWLNADGKWLFSEDDLTQAMAYEVVRLADLLGTSISTPTYPEGVTLIAGVRPVEGS